MKLYPNEYVYHIEDQNFYDEYLSQFNGATQEEAEGEEYRKAFKALCNTVRRGVGEHRVIGFGIKDDYTVDVLVYEIEATDDNFYTQEWEKTSDGHVRPYVIVEEGIVV